MTVVLICLHTAQVFSALLLYYGTKSMSCVWFNIMQFGKYVQCCGGVCYYSLVLCRSRQYIPTFLTDYTVSRPRRVLFVVTALIIPMSQEKDKLEYVCRWPSSIICIVNALEAGNGAEYLQTLWFSWFFWWMFSKFPDVTPCAVEHHTTCILSSFFLVEWTAT